MKLMNKISVRHLKMNKKRSLITIFGIMLSVAMITAVFGFVLSFQDYYVRIKIENIGNWHVSFKDIPEDKINKLKENELFTEYFYDKDENDMEIIKFAVRNPNKNIYDDCLKLAEELSIDSGSMEFNNDLLRAMGIMTGNTFTAIYGIAFIGIAVIILGSVFVISNAFYISSSERCKEFGMLKSVGATRKQIFQSIAFEGIALSVVAIPLGFLLGLLIEFIALTITNYLMVHEYEHIQFRVVISWVVVILSIVLSFITVMLSSFFPGRKASKISAIDAIRQTNEVKIRSNKVKVSRLNSMIFGFEGVLAAKSLKRSRTKYRATIISLVVSIVLFMTASMLGIILKKSAEMVFNETNTNFMLQIYYGDSEIKEKSINEILQLTDEKIYEINQLSHVGSMDDKILSEEGKELFGYGNYESTEIQVNMISISNEDFKELCDGMNKSLSDFLNIENPSGILINSTGTLLIDSKSKEFNPFNIGEGQNIALKDNTDLVVGGVTEVIPKFLVRFLNRYAINIIVADDIYNTMIRDDTESRVLTGNLKEVDDFCLKAREILNENLKDSFTLLNYDEMERVNRSTYLIMMLFIYGFTAMLSLIGITNIISTISTNMELRKKEFAVLSSVGMSKKSFTRMFNYESLFYGLKSLFIGIPLGLLVSYLLFNRMTQRVDFDFIWPWEAILICIAVIMLLSFATTHYANKKQKKGSIVETLQQNNI